jgi:NAD-dependent SIR2 family protein deacetylase
MTYDFDDIDRLNNAICNVDCIIIGAGSGLSTSAGFIYDGPIFYRHFEEFEKKYGFDDMYSGSFYPYETLEEMWAFWSIMVNVNRYSKIPLPVYDNLLKLVKHRDYFVITTNVDHCFQKAGFDKKRLYYTQGDYGLFQCSKPCCNKTYDNYEVIQKMVAQQKDLKIPSELVPKCPVCGAPMSMNLRSDDTFVQDEGWYEAEKRYKDFLEEHRGAKTLYLELGVGYNTPGIIKYPFWYSTMENPNAVYICINNGNVYVPDVMKDRSVCIKSDIGRVLKTVIERRIKEVNGL